MQLQQPEWLLILLLPMALSIIAATKLASRHQFVSKALLPWSQLSQITMSRGLIHLRYFLYALMWLAFAIAMSGPRSLEKDSADHLRKSVDIMLVLDVSRSMLAEDVLPNRISRAKSEIITLIELSRGDRFGIIVYAGKSLLVSPLSKDKKSLIKYLVQLDANMLPVYGSHLDLALDKARNSLLSSENRAKAILLVSDGELSDDLAGSKIQNQIRLLRRSNISVYSLGMGTLAGGAIPARKGGWLKYHDKTVISKLNQSFLTDLSQQTGGKYTSQSDSDSDSRLLYSDGISNLASYQIDASDQKYLVWLEYFDIPLIIAINCLLILIVLPSQQGVNKNQAIQGLASRDIKKSIVMLLLVSLLYSCSVDEDRSAYESALKAYKSKQFDNSETLFSHGQGYSALIGAGSSAYRLKKYQKAARYFSFAFRQASSDVQRASALFNMANSNFFSQNYAAALQYYQDTLIYNSKHEKARDNYKICKQVYINFLKNAGYDETITSRVGKGPQFRRALPDLKIDRGAAGLDNKEEENKNKNYQYDVRNKIDAQAKSLLKSTQLKGKNSHLNRSAFVKHKIVSAQSNYITQLKVLNLKQDDNFMWKRMFFFENNIFVPENEFMTLPNTKPW